MIDPGDDRAFIGHPKGLGYLAFTEAWERFSYYGMQSLLVLYLAKYLLVGSNADAVALFGPFKKFSTAGWREQRSPRRFSAPMPRWSISPRCWAAWSPTAGWARSARS